MKKYRPITWAIILLGLCVFFPLALPFAALVYVVRMLDVNMHNRRIRRCYGKG